MSSNPKVGDKRQRSIADMFGIKVGPPTSKGVDAVKTMPSKKSLTNSAKESQKIQNFPARSSSLPMIAYQKLQASLDPESYYQALSAEFKRLLQLEFDPSSGLGPSYLPVLKSQLTQQYFLDLKTFLIDREGLGQPKCDIYPDHRHIYLWSRITPLDQVKVVIIGQDPYHGPRQAHGLSFSVPKGVPIPGSLRNIHEELKREFPGFKPPSHGSLVSWAKSGVLLLNTSLTVRKAQAGSHSKQGWENFTDAIVDAIDLYGGITLLKDQHGPPCVETAACKDGSDLDRDDEKPSEEKRVKLDSSASGTQPIGFGKGVVFLCWGKWAADRVDRLSSTKHLILKSAHPSPLSAHRGFLGNDHFKKANEWLESRYGALSVVNWCDLKE